MEGLGQGAAEGGGGTPPREEASEQQPVTPRMSLKDQVRLASFLGAWMGLDLSRSTDDPAFPC